MTPGKRTYLQLLILCCWLVFSLPVHAQEPSLREKIPLEGTWMFRLDSLGVGIKENWQDSSFRGEVKLPGSLAENQKGRPVAGPVSSRLNQTWEYTGPAWFQKEIEIPPSWHGKPVELFLERSKVTQVWIDGELIGKSSLLAAPQVYPLERGLAPGKHMLTILVDNSPGLVSVGGSHALSEHTQTNWNGIIGKMHLEATENLKIGQVKTTPDVKNKAVHVQIRLRNFTQAPRDVMLTLQAASTSSDAAHTARPKQLALKLSSGDTILSAVYPLGKKALLWNEYTPALYRLSVTLGTKERRYDRVSLRFGLREFRPAGTQFRINDDITFLRGKNESCIFPLTGYPPTDTASWRKLYRTAKRYGINHYRFHSYTPPEAAFEAADAEGVYIQAELPNWANFTVRDTFHTGFQYQEGQAIFDAYGNHPSFVMFSLGNELGGDESVHDKMVRDLRDYDNGRRLYARGTNAFYEAPEPGPADDFWVTMRTGKETPDGKYDVRGSFATTEDAGSGIINSQQPSARRDFSSALEGWELPVVGHENGQYQVYPDYTEMPRYSGVLRPLNFGIFKQRLEAAGMGDQAADFFRASGMLSALLYRKEIEMAIRTPGFAGFQLLDLQDFPGQGTALVGLLNAFMESKGLVSPEEFRRFNNDVVIQLLMDKYTWVNNETFTADVQLVNYSTQHIRDQELTWKVSDGSGRELASGILPVRHAGKGGIKVVGDLSFPLHKVSKAAELRIQLSLSGSARKIEYPIWVYPAAVSTTVPEHLTVATALNQEVARELDEGGTVLLFPAHESVRDKSVNPQFISEFWNWKVFKESAKKAGRPVSAGTLGIFTHPEHPLFNSFPTAFHTDWQWWPITNNARPLILDSTAENYRPIVQVIDNIDRNHKLGLIFEFKAGAGKLLVCMADLPRLLDKPEARQLYHSMLNYIASDDFDPRDCISLQELKELL